MKTYILTEKIMNGTVTLNIITTIFRSQSFKKIINKLKVEMSKLNEHRLIKFSIENDNEEKFSYNIEGEDYLLYGYILNKEQKIVTV